MDLDNITDIEVLRNIAKKYMVKVKVNILSDNGICIFRAGHWYDFEQSDFDITIFSDDGQSHYSFSYEKAGEYLYEVSDE